MLRLIRILFPSRQHIPYATEKCTDPWRVKQPELAAHLSPTSVIKRSAGLCIIFTQKLPSNQSKKQQDEAAASPTPRNINIPPPGADSFKMKLSEEPARTIQNTDMNPTDLSNSDLFIYFFIPSIGLYIREILSSRPTWSCYSPLNPDLSKNCFGFS